MAQPTSREVFTRRYIVTGEFPREGNLFQLDKQSIIYKS
jgi:hypothetical protein